MKKKLQKLPNLEINLLHKGEENWQNWQTLATSLIRETPKSIIAQNPTIRYPEIALNRSADRRVAERKGGDKRSERLRGVGAGSRGRRIKTESVTTSTPLWTWFSFLNRPGCPVPPTTCTHAFFGPSPSDCNISLPSSPRICSSSITRRALGVGHIDLGAGVGHLTR